MPVQTDRPVNLDLFRFRLPIVGISSIAHRISGVLLFLFIPVLLWLLDLSLRGEAGFARAAEAAGGWFAWLVSIVLAWALFHHLAAGIRYLLIDVDVGVEKEQARLSAKVVLAVGLVGAILGLLGVFV
ncbi:succinate dehydrogenase, cytochrome b556 subunit [Inmirania thermothiophila]|uniref:Succinate dehydrogenase cytochrome b556 subunit n=1 Tax=Inmirania thermothiophila TaxID=1750597 RepID=A0A3N1XZU0_9GAMM|nr:succinate dehydrogenase, cytochrome b556 subunit [Inmirania thermothiophila]ROR32115.1 succinate dehydrogenase subunit C [Inmirania thermothiophila]